MTTAPAANSNTFFPEWTFAEKFRKARKIAGMEQREFASVLGLTASTVAAYETGRSEPRFRDAAGLATAAEVVARLKEEAPRAAIDDKGTVFNQDVIAAFELGYMLDVAEAIVLAAQERRESRGAQFRIDFPRRDDAGWLHHITVSRNGDDAPQVGKAAVAITRWQPQERTY